MVINTEQIEQLKAQVMKKCQDRIDQGERRATMHSPLASRMRERHGLC